MSQLVQVTYFDEPGPQNTEDCLTAALARAQALGIKHAVVASDTGKTAREVLTRFHPELKVVVVTNPAGMQLPISHLHDYLPRFKELRERLTAEGVAKVPASLSEETMAELRGAGAEVQRVDWRALAAYTRSGLTEIDRIGVATRVALTISVWGYLSRALPEGTDVVAIAGCGFGGGGADTALVVRSARDWRDWRVLETIARPRVSPPSEQ